MLKAKDKITTLKLLPTLKTLFELISENGDKTASEYTKDNEIEKISYSELEWNTKCASFKLEKILCGENKGRFIGIKVDNCPKWTVLFWSVLMAGYKPVMMDFRGDSSLLEHIIKQTNAIAVISDKDDSSFQSIQYISSDQLFTANEIDENWKPSWENELALCTSGTTASSKVFVFDGQAIGITLLGAETLRENPVFVPDIPARVLSFLPYHHISGLVSVLFLHSLHGNSFVYLKDRGQSTVFEACRKHKVTHVSAVPLFYNNLARRIAKMGAEYWKDNGETFAKLSDMSIDIQRKFKSEGRDYVSQKMFKDFQNQLLGNCIHQMGNGGGHILPESLRIINSIGYYLIGSYGMTEVGVTSVEASNDMDMILSSRLGKAFPTVEYKLENINETNETGELFIRGGTLHSYRMANGEAVLPDIDEEGWYNSGDIARLKDGHLWIEGRAKDVIINESGENVYPDELEGYFSQLEQVHEMCITGVKPDKDKYYENITLLLNIGKSINDKTTKEQLTKEIFKINNNLPVFKRIQDVLITSIPFPRSSSMKIQRQKLKSLLENRNIDAEKLDIINVMISEKPVMQEEKASDNNDMTSNLNTISIKNEVRKCFAEILNIPEESIGYTAHFNLELEGDSLQSIELLSKIEKKYNIAILESEYYKCTNVEDITKMLLKKLQGDETSEEQKHVVNENIKRTPVVKFEDSKEYKDFYKRLMSLEDTKNPFFVCHDSALLDTSIVGDRTVLNFGSFNYLGLSGHPALTKAAQEAASLYGTSASGSRLISGEKTLYQELDREIAKWEECEDAITLVGGHSTNVSFIGNFCGENDLILYDSLSHNSITQGCQLSKSETKAFPHNDYAALEQILQKIRNNYEKVLIVAEGAYSMDGDIAPIPEFVRIKKKYGALLMIDEAHSSFVIGKTGKGVSEHFNLQPNDIDIKMGTLSKGLGACGGYIASSKSIIEYSRYYLPGFIYTCGMSPPVAAAALAGIKLLKEDSTVVTDLHSNIECFLNEAHKRNFNTCLANGTAIIPILVGGDNFAYELSNLMLEKGVYVPAVVYPVVPKNSSRLRFCVTSKHTHEQIKTVLDVLKEVSDKIGKSLPGLDK